MSEKKENKFVGFFIFFGVAISLMLFYPDDNEAYLVDLKNGDRLDIRKKIQNAPKNLQVSLLLLLDLDLQKYQIQL